MYILNYRPYDDPSTNKNEIFNEACVLAVSYLLFIFTDYVDDYKMKEYAGYGLIGGILLNFGVNILIQIIQMFYTLP